MINQGSSMYLQYMSNERHIQQLSSSSHENDLDFVHKNGLDSFKNGCMCPSHLPKPTNIEEILMENII